VTLITEFWESTTIAFFTAELLYAYFLRKNSPMLIWKGAGQAALDGRNADRAGVIPSGSMVFFVVQTSGSHWSNARPSCYANDTASTFHPLSMSPEKRP
jgi:hypothetical protein